MIHYVDRSHQTPHPVVSARRITVDPPSIRRRDQEVELLLSDSPAFDVRLKNEVPQNGTSCKVFRGRRRGDSDWLVIHIGHDGQREIDHFVSEMEARTVADRLSIEPGQRSLQSQEPSVEHTVELLLHKPAWWI